MSLSTVIIGAGAWGQAMAYLCLKTDPHSKITIIRKKQSTKKLCPQLRNAKNIILTDQIDNQIIQPKCAVIIATPSTAVADTLSLLKKHHHKGDILCAAKGFVEEHDVLYPHELYEKINPQAKSFSYLYGPTFADEVIDDLPAQAVLATTSVKSGQQWQKRLHNQHFQTIASSDLKGLAWCSVFKNIVAIIAGCMKACNLGLNAQALLITHATKELQSIIQKIDGDPHTAYSLAGIGDIVLSASSNKSRNFQFGEHIASEKGVTHKTIEGKANLQLMYRKLKPIERKMPTIMKLAEQCIAKPKQCRVFIIEWLQSKAQSIQNRMTQKNNPVMPKS